jgi:hypothetical protein
LPYVLHQNQGLNFAGRQKITTSTTEAELLALSHTTQTYGGSVSFQAPNSTQKKQAMNPYDVITNKLYRFYKKISLSSRHT